MKQKMKFVKSGLFVALMAGTGLASDGLQPVEPTVDSASLSYLTTRVESFMAKAGLSFGGEFRSRALSSSLSGNLVDESTKSGKFREDVMFTSLDLEMNVGPHSALQGRAIIRLHQDWRNMFASFTTPLSTRWLSIDGNVNNIFFYNAGDFKEKYTSLTLWAPEPEIMYEPYIFARQRKEVMNEVFAGDNNRVLQGVNLGFMAKISPAFDELSAKAFLTRTRTEGKEAGAGVPTDTDAKGVSMDRYSLGGNLFFGVRKDLELGITPILTRDSKASALDGDSAAIVKEDWDQTFVLGGNLGLGTGFISAIDAERLNVRLDAEFAMSNYSEVDDNFKQVSENGMAFNANLGTKLGIGDAGSVKLDLGYIYNDEKFVNELAQSPIFFNRVIMNTASFKDGSNYNSFDGLYKSVFKYTPGDGEMSTKEPMQKIAWTRGVLTSDELDDLVEGAAEGSNESVSLDKTFSPIMHFGQATPNRSGVQTGLSLELLEKAILLSGEFNMINTPKIDKTISEEQNRYDYMQFGGGASLDVAKFGNWWNYPLILSGSLRHTETTAEKEYDSNFKKQTVTFGNGGLYWKFWKRAAVMGGAQVLMTKAEKADKSLKVGRIETQWAGGLEYKVTDGGTLTGTVGQILSNNPDNMNDPVEASANNFQAWQFDLFLTVVF